jgi:penicillin-binding protein 1A
MALPIYALFMQKVYADPTLGYSETETFDIPGAYVNLCQDTELTIQNGGGIDKMFE